MPGVINKTNTIKNAAQIVKMGGFRLFFAVLTAKSGTPFLTVYTQTTLAR